VTLGLGSVVASAAASAPWLAAVSRNKDLVFVGSAAMLAFNYWLVVVRPRRCAPGETCHVDSPSMRWNRRIFWFSATVYVLAAIVTFGSPMLFSDF
jgi:hypothetical protein